MMNLEQANTAVDNIMVATGIKAVYYVDDKFQEDAKIDDRLEEFLNAIERCHADGQIEGLPDNVRYADNYTLDAEIRTWWSDMSNQQKQQEFEKYVTEGAENIRPALLLKETMAHLCTCCSPSEWNDYYKAEALNKIKEKKSVLLLFDYELSNGRNGLQYAEDILKIPSADDCTYCGIISNQFGIEGEFQKRNDYKQQLPDYYIYPLSKNRLIINEGDYEPFISGLKNILWVKHIESIKNHTKEIFRKAFDMTIDRYLDIQPPAYKQIIVDSSHKEGCREIDTTLRLIQIILDKEIKGAITEDTLSIINNEIKSILTIHNTDIVSQYPEVDEQAKGFIKDERFLDGNIINSLYTPLQNGDIFEIDDFRWILLCQPCNISIRNKGNRNNKYDTGFLVLLTPTDKIPINSPLLDEICRNVKNMLPQEAKQMNSQKLNSYKKEIQKLLASENQLNCSLDFEIERIKYTAQFNKFQTISLSLLDNVSFNKEGKAIIDFNSTDLPKGLHRNLVVRQNNIKEQFENWVHIKQNINDLCYDCQWLVDIKVFFSKFSQGFKYENIEADKITLPIQRIGHYRNPYSDNLLTQFSHYISRAGFPHPFV